MPKLPAIHFYTGDWMKDPGVRASSYAARGLWMDMLCLMNEAVPRGCLTTNGTPLTLSSLARMTGGDPEEVSRLLSELSAHEVFSTDRRGIIFCRRMVRDERKRKLCSEAGLRGGGNPTLIGTERSTHKGTYDSDTPLRNGKEETREGVEGEIPQTLKGQKFQDAWAMFLKHRSEIRKPVRASMAKALLKKLGAWGQEKAIAAIENSVANGWQGVFEPIIEETPEQRGKRIAAMRS